MKKEIYKMNRQIAYEYWANVQMYLQRNKEKYPLFKCERKSRTYISKISNQFISTQDDALVRYLKSSN